MALAAAEVAYLLIARGCASTAELNVNARCAHRRLLISHRYLA